MTAEAIFLQRRMHPLGRIHGSTRQDHPYHPQANGIVVAFNKILGNTLTKICVIGHKDWDDRDFVVLWAYRMTYKRLTKFTPFQLVFRKEAVLPLEFLVPSLCLAHLGNLDDRATINQRLEALMELDEKRLLTCWSREGKDQEYPAKVMKQQVEAQLTTCDETLTERRQKVVAAGKVLQTDQKLRVCDICGAFLSIYDSDRRLADHFGGKLHLGYIQIRQKLNDLREERNKAHKLLDEQRNRASSRDRERAPSKDQERDPVRERDRGRDHRSKERDRDRERERSVDHRSHRRSRSRSREMSKERSRDRERDRSDHY
ncbi:hypothetical protein KI387_001021, partial [Taxus chinensis]